MWLLSKFTTRIPITVNTILMCCDFICTAFFFHLNAEINITQYFHPAKNGNFN
jgi:hypothetical protein